MDDGDSRPDAEQSIVDRLEAATCEEHNREEIWYTEVRVGRHQHSVLHSRCWCGAEWEVCQNCNYIGGDWMRTQYRETDEMQFEHYEF